MSIVVFATKGGVGRTTMAANISAALAKTGLKVVIVDCDSQCSTSTFFDQNHNIVSKNVNETNTSTKEDQSELSTNEANTMDNLNLEEEEKEDEERKEKEESEESDATDLLLKRKLDERERINDCDLEASIKRARTFVYRSLNKFNTTTRTKVTLKGHSPEINQTDIVTFRVKQGTIADETTLQSYIDNLNDSKSPLFRCFQQGVAEQQFDRARTILLNADSYERVKSVEHLFLLRGSTQLNKFNDDFISTLKSNDRSFPDKKNGFINYMINCMGTALNAEIVIFDISVDQSAMNTMICSSCDFVLPTLNACIFSCPVLSVCLNDLFPTFLETHRKSKRNLLKWFELQSASPNSVFSIEEAKKMLMTPDAPVMLPILINNFQTSCGRKNPCVSDACSEIVQAMATYIAHQISLKALPMKMMPLNNQYVLPFMDNKQAFGQCADMAVPIVASTAELFRQYFMPNDSIAGRKYVEVFERETKDATIRIMSFARWLKTIYRRRFLAMAEAMENDLRSESSVYEPASLNEPLIRRRVRERQLSVSEQDIAQCLLTMATSSASSF